MKKEELICKIKTCIDENIDAQKAYREKHIKKAMNELSKSVGTIDSCLVIKDLLDDENTLRKTLNDRHHWVMSIETIVNNVENTLDQCLYDIDYELITAYKIRVVINDVIALHLDHEKSASYEGGCTTPNCILYWGIAHLEREPEPTKMTRCNAGDPSAILKLMDAVEHAAYPHRYQ